VKEELWILCFNRINFIVKRGLVGRLINPFINMPHVKVLAIIGNNLIVLAFIAYFAIEGINKNDNYYNASINFMIKL